MNIISTTLSYQFSRVPRNDGIILNILCHHRPRPDNALFPDIGHDERGVSDPCVFADGNLLEDTPLFPNRPIKIVERVLFAAAHDVHIAADGTIIGDFAFPDIALRPDIYPFADLRIRLGENRAEHNGAIFVATGHGILIKAFSQIASSFTRKKT